MPVIVIDGTTTELPYGDRGKAKDILVPIFTSWLFVFPDATSYAERWVDSLFDVADRINKTAVWNYETQYEAWTKGYGNYRLEEIITLINSGKVTPLPRPERLADFRIDVYTDARRYDYLIYHIPDSTVCEDRGYPNKPTPTPVRYTIPVMYYPHILVAGDADAPGTEISINGKRYRLVEFQMPVGRARYWVELDEHGREKDAFYFDRSYRP